MKSHSADISGSQVRGTDKYSAAKKFSCLVQKFSFYSFYCVSKSLLKSVAYPTIKRYDTICDSSNSFLWLARSRARHIHIPRLRCLSDEHKL